MEGQPEARAGSGGAARQGDLGLIEIPVLGLTAGELQGAGAVEHRAFDRRDESVGRGVLDRTVFHGDHGDARFECGLEHVADHGAVAAGPAAAVDVEEQGRGLVGLRTPEVDPLHAVRTIGDVLVRLDRQGIFTELRVAGFGRGRCLGRRVGSKERYRAQGQGDDGSEQGCAHEGKMDNEG